MVLYDHRMIEGQALHYYYPHETHRATNPVYTFFHSTDPYLDYSYDYPKNSMMPASPYSSQSDSDSSLSSIEISSRQIRSRNKNKNQMKCCWKSCGVTFESLDLLACHVTKVHASSGVGGLFYCGWEGCSRNDRGFNARYKMLVHVRTHTNEKPHKCQLCDKSFSRAENLKIHSRSHSGEKPYVCPVPGCNKAYSNSSDRFKHTRTHQVEKPYHCKVPGCTKRYTDPSSLRKHVKTYKHFINENCVPSEHKPAEESLKESSDDVHVCEEQTGFSDEVHVCNDQIGDSRAVPYTNHAVNESDSDCNFLYCKRINKTSDILRIEALINMKENQVQSLQWNNFLPPYLPNPSQQETMDVDMPLDLSIHSKAI